MAKNQINIETQTLLARIDERTANLTIDVQKISKSLETNYITKDQFDPVKKIVYGVISVLLIAFVTALIRIVMIK